MCSSILKITLTWQTLQKAADIWTLCHGKMPSVRNSRQSQMQVQRTDFETQVPRRLTVRKRPTGTRKVLDENQDPK